MVHRVGCKISLAVLCSSREVLVLLEMFRRMVNDSIRIGLVNGVYSLRRLSLLSYNQLANYDVPGYYKLCAISRAAGILAARKKTIRRGFPTREPYAIRQQLVCCYGFKVTGGVLEIPISRGKRLPLPLTNHTLSVMSQPGVKVRSFTLTGQIEPLHHARHSQNRMHLHGGVNRNLRNLTVGNDQETSHYDLSKCVRIAKTIVRIATTTVRIVTSFTRNDDRIRTGLASKYGQRRADRLDICFTLRQRRLLQRHSSGEKQ